MLGERSGVCGCERERERELSRDDGVRSALAGFAGDLENRKYAWLALHRYTSIMNIISSYVQQNPLVSCGWGGLLALAVGTPQSPGLACPLFCFLGEEGGGAELKGVQRWPPFPSWWQQRLQGTGSTCLYQMQHQCRGALALMLQLHRTHPLTSPPPCTPFFFFFFLEEANPPQSFSVAETTSNT